MLISSLSAVLKYLIAFLLMQGQLSWRVNKLLKTFRSSNHATLRRSVNIRMAEMHLQSEASSSSGDGTSTIVNNAKFVRNKMNIAASNGGRDPASIKLVAVSKTKPPADILALYQSGHRDFGENYFQELLEKAEQLPGDIRWHFIGHLQSAKAPKLVKSVANLAVVETVDSLKLAKKLDNACEAAERSELDIYVQVDTSGEDAKSGVPPSEAPGLAQSIQNECKRLRIKGLMTIGAPGDLSCFDRLVETRAEVAAALGLADPNALGLSMGMSGDFEDAIARGATSVRVGSTIFGARDYSK
jgi:PLP dependent protein